MTQLRSIHKPIKLNRDKDPKYIGADEAYYLLNHERNLGGGARSNTGKTTPFPANEKICQVDAGEGTPYSIGSFKSPLTNEIYTFWYNDGGDNFITRTNPDKTCEIVYQGECLSFSADPRHAIKNWRVTLKYDKFCAHRHGKQLIWTDGLNEIGMVDVEASIATDYFSTPFFSICANECAHVQMCVPKPCEPLTAEFVSLPPEEVDLNNFILDTGFQFRFRHIYYDQRASEWSSISSLYFFDSKACFESGSGAPRCLKMRVPIGNPLVDRIEVAFRKNNQAQWYLYDTIDKYEPYSSEDQKWYERELADLEGFSEEDCSFDYYFCNDKQCSPISVESTDRVFNPSPREPQGLFPVKDGVAFYNFKEGVCPLLESETKKVEININCNTDDCGVELAEVTFHAIIYQPQDQTNQPILRLGGEFEKNFTDDKSDTAFFGGLEYAIIPREAGRGAYHQYFTGKTRNFIAYIEGTSYSVEMEQWVASPLFTNKEKFGVAGGMADVNDRREAAAFIQNGSFFFQKGKMRVPKGTKGFIRLVNHKKTSGLGSSQDTSTLVWGTIPTLDTYYGTKDLSSDINDREYELYFDTCDGDTEVEEALVVLDFDIDNRSGAHSSRSFGGYIKDEEGHPIEGAEVWYDNGLGSALKSYTDHNGYYRFMNFGNGTDGDISVDIKVEQSGGFTVVKTVILNGVYGYAEKDIEIDTPGYLVDFYEDLSIYVQDCDGNPISGVRVAMSGSKYKVSEEITGIAHFKMRNFSSDLPRQFTAILMDANGCFNVSCSGECNPCGISTSSSLSSDLEGVPYSSGVLLGLNIESALVNRKGLKAGGRYPIGIVAEGDCGKISGVYPVTVLDGSLPSDGSFLNIPKTQQKSRLSFCKYQYDATGYVAPYWADCVHIVRGANLNPYELQWVIDKVEKLNDGKMRLTIQSLNDYNAEFNFKSNTIYQYLKNDRVEFISSGTGEIFDSATYGILNYHILSPFADLIIAGDENPPAEFFNQILIQADDTLNDLTEEQLVGAKIELQRPKDCTDEHLAYFEVLTLPLIEVSGQKVIANPVGEFTTFDTYLVNRLIGTTGLQVFEHRNPSDFWGDELNGISDAGRPHFVNKYENEKRNGRKITINSPTQYNRFGDLTKVLDAPEHGDLISVGVYDGKIGIGIGEYDNFLFQISDDFLRVGNDGVVRAAPADAIISDTEPKVQGRFGCQYPHIGSIYYGDGFVTWADVSKGEYVKHDFSVAHSMSENILNSYFRIKWSQMEAFNATASSDLEKYRFSNGFNHHTQALHLTMRQLNGGGICNEKDALLSNNETVLIEPRTGEFLTYHSATPEEYSNLDVHDANGCAFICFYKGATYFHPVKATRFNEFFGVAVDRVITIAVNQEPEYIKRLVSLELQSTMMYFISKVVVDNPSFLSEVPPVKVKRSEDKFNAAFLGNINSRGGLYSTEGSVGITPRGYYALITFVRDNTDNLKYDTINDSKRVLFDTLDNILIKYFHSMQSGMVENV